MTAITLHLPDDKAARLRARAEASGEDPDAFAVAAVLRALDELDELDEEDELTPDDLAAIGAGLADLDAGRVKPGAAVFAGMDAHLAELKRAKQQREQQTGEQQQRAA